jgi:hypothetical protein
MADLTVDRTDLVSWIITHTDVLHSKAEAYATLLSRENIGNASRLAKNIIKHPNFLGE